MHRPIQEIARCIRRRALEPARLMAAKATENRAALAAQREEAQAQMRTISALIGGRFINSFHGAYEVHAGAIRARIAPPALRREGTPQMGAITFQIVVSPGRGAGFAAAVRELIRQQAGDTADAQPEHSPSGC